MGIASDYISAATAAKEAVIAAETALHGLAIPHIQFAPGGGARLSSDGEIILIDRKGRLISFSPEEFHAIESWCAQIGI